MTRLLLPPCCWCWRSRGAPAALQALRSLPHRRVLQRRASSGGLAGAQGCLQSHAQGGFGSHPSQGQRCWLKRRLNEIYVKHTGNPYEVVEAALERDNFMSAEDAKAWGLIDEILEGRGKMDDASK